MITRLAVKNFKSLRDVDLKLGLFNIFIGTNASGKSNFIDALGVLQGIGNGFTFHEILDGKPKSATSEVWEGIRGGSHFATWIKNSNAPISIDVEGYNQSFFDRVQVILDKLRSIKTNDIEDLSEEDLSELQSVFFNWSYKVAFISQSGKLTEERLTLGGEPVYDSTQLVNKPQSPTLKVKYTTGNKGPKPSVDFAKHRPILSQIAKDDLEKPSENHILQCSSLLLSFSNLQKINPSTEKLRDYSRSQVANRLGESGENFAALVKTICKNSTTKTAYISWLKELRPHEVDDVVILRGAVGEPLFAIKEGDNTFSAKVLSDGTLRFAALAAAMFQPDKPDLMIFEEIENGIHPQRMRLLVELLRTQTAESQKQVVVTTHSPALLDWLKETEYQYAFLCKRDEETGESRITPLSEIPNFFEVIKTTPPSQLFTEGWFEAAV